MLRYEDYIAAPRQHLEAVLAFLGVDAGGATDARTWEAMLREEVSNRNAYPPMLGETRALLGELYSETNEALAGVLGDERWRWSDVAAGAAEPQPGEPMRNAGRRQLT